MHPIWTVMDSNSDSDDGDECEEAAVFLGYAKEAKSSVARLRNHFPSKMGGEPAWLDPMRLPWPAELTCQM